MADIFHTFSIKAPLQDVFHGISSPDGLDSWWTKRSAGRAIEGMSYELWFGPEHDWRAIVTKCVPNAEFELKMSRAHPDWLDTRVGFALRPEGSGTRVEFHHLGWPDANDHFRISTFCWAMYLRALRRHLECGEKIAYEDRIAA